MLKKVQSVRLGLVLLVTSCDLPRLPTLVDGGSPPSLELFAGNIGGAGNADGIGAAARFDAPSGVAVDGAGNIYIADSGNHTIRKVTNAGVVTTLAGTAGIPGSADGTGAAARFYQPTGVAVDSVGNVYVADSNNNTIRKVSPAGVVTTFAGTAGTIGNADGRGADARFLTPTGVAVDSAGNVYVADSLNCLIRKITADGVVATLAGTAAPQGCGSGDSMGAGAYFNHPVGVAVDDDGNVYVADQLNSTIRKVSPFGLVSTLAGFAEEDGSRDGKGASALFHWPSGVAVDKAGNVFVADCNNSTIRKITPDGVVTTPVGFALADGSTDGTGADARFAVPLGVASDGNGNVYVADTGNQLIRKVTSAGVVTTLAGTAAMVGSADGAGAEALFAGPVGVAIDNAGSVYVADCYNGTIRKVASGVATTLAGYALAIGSADGTGAAARFRGPTGVAVDSTGNVYVADRANSTIRKVTPAGIVTTLAGAAGTAGSADGTGADARFSFPAAVAVDTVGNIYVADEFNNTIRKVSATGVVTTLAGTAGTVGSADGTGAAARFHNPVGVAVDSAGNVYVADLFNAVIRKVTSVGRVTTLAGTAGTVGSADGAGTDARFHNPIGVAVDSAGNIYVADGGNPISETIHPIGRVYTVSGDNATIRKITPTGVTTTVAGTAGTTGVLLGATPRFASPQGLAIAGDSIVISDANAILLLRHGAQ